MASRSDEGDDLARALEAEARAASAARRAGHALSEGEERLDDEAPDVTVAEIEALRWRHEKAESAAERARERRREVEDAMDQVQVIRTYFNAVNGRRS